MRTIDRSSAFKHDYKRESKGQHRATLDDALKPVLVALATDQPLDARYRDHDLSGCHFQKTTAPVHEAGRHVCRELLNEAGQQTYAPNTRTDQNCTAPSCDLV
jgi:mRNA-degrading endonuclease YafQ of YafQ-DinJ toxin-antitoxin module